MPGMCAIARSMLWASKNSNADRTSARCRFACEYTSWIAAKSVTAISSVLTAALAGTHCTATLVIAPAASHSDAQYGAGRQLEF